MPAEEIYVLPKKTGTPITINLVKPTDFEAFCLKVASENTRRDFHFWVLENIMHAYSFMRCQLGCENRKVSISEINTVMKQKDKVISNGFYEPLNTWGKSDRSEYFKRQIFWDCLSRFHISQGQYQVMDFVDRIVNKLSPLENIALEENLWDPETKEINRKKIKEYITKYTWAFPPNTLELLEEMVASPEIRLEFEKKYGKKLEAE